MITEAEMLLRSAATFHRMGRYQLEAAIQSLHDHQPILDRFGITALPKPFDLQELLDTIERAIGLRPGQAG